MHALLALIVGVACVAAAPVPGRHLTSSRASARSETRAQREQRKVDHDEMQVAKRSAHDAAKQAKRGARKQQQRRLAHDGSEPESGGSVSNGVCNRVVITNDAEAAEAAKCTLAVNDFIIYGEFSQNYISLLKSTDADVICMSGCGHWKFPDLESIGWSLDFHEDDSLVEIKDMFPVLDNVGDGDLDVDGCVNLELIDDFHKLVQVYDNVEFTKNPKLRHIRGFEELVSMGDDFLINKNPMLESIPEFPELVAIGYWLEIEENNKLRTVEGFNKVKMCNDGINIIDNAALETINGFNSLGGMEDELKIYRNAKLKTINGFNGLVWMDDEIEIYQNPELLEITGFNARGLWMEGDIEFWGNLKLETIDAFHGAVFIDCVEISNHPELVKFDAFNQLRSTYDVEIEGAAKLTEIKGFEKLLSVGEILLTDMPSLRKLSGFYRLRSLQYELQLENVGIETLDAGAEESSYPGDSEPNDSRRLDSESDSESDSDSVGRRDSGGGSDSDDGPKSAFGRLGSVPEIRIVETGLKTLTGFSALQMVEAEIKICGNADLMDLNGLGSVSDAAPGSQFESLVIAGNPNLMDLGGMPQAIVSMAAIEFGIYSYTPRCYINGEHDGDGSYPYESFCPALKDFGANGAAMTESVVDAAFQKVTTADFATFVLADGSSYICGQIPGRLRRSLEISCDFSNGVFDE